MKRIMIWLAACLLSISAWAGQAVNINTASAEELSEGLKGVGLTKAEAIVAYRQSHGDFRHIDELVNVKGIGLRTIDRNRDNILLQEQPEVASQDH